MNGDRDDLPQEWQEHDETLLDHSAGQAPPEAARDWLMEQRFVHGLLRAMNTDAGTREQRVQSILKEISARRRSTPVWWSLAAALLLALIAWFVVPGLDRLPRAEACVARALEHMKLPVDRRFRLTIQGEGLLLFGRHRELTLTTRPGMRFLIQGPVGSAGCDGTKVWILAPGMVRPMAVPLSEAQGLLARMGDVLDLGYLDVQALLQRLPEGFEMKARGRESGQVRVEATRLPERLQDRVESVSMLCDEQSGMVTRIEVRTTPHKNATRTLVFEYVGTVELQADAYQVPR